ncbi:13333_t:CDS:2 [Cetraspora pellucida]|uniref:13333_t:CDS:1 n=1 Tax=Cetraspora pellucida TaxID=1433469 RepID=A0A9N8WR21_9GLOM|nr:13333_t:CDS:2 [Cetraspora pellucida]
MTILNGQAFHWTTNSKTKKFFKFLNPALILSSQHILSNCILDTKRINYIKLQEQTLNKDSIKEETNTSSEKKRIIEIIPKIKNIIKDALNGLNKLNSDMDKEYDELHNNELSSIKTIDD